MNEYFHGEQYDTVVLPAAGIILSLETDRPGLARPGQARPGLVKPDLAPGTSPSAVQPQEARYAGLGDIMPWGDGNDFPQRITALYAKDSLIPTTLGKVSSMLVGRGVKAVLEDIDENGEEITRPLPKNDVVTAEINRFIDNILFRRYLSEMSADISTFFNGWPELLLSKNRQKIVQLHPLNAEECRWARMDEKGNLNHIYLNANWPSGSPDDGYTEKINALDPYRWDRVDWLRGKDFYNCVYPISYPTPGKRFYSLAHHHSIVESGWLDVHQAIPAFKKYLLKNQMAAKWHVKVNSAYWPIRFGSEWSATDKAKNARLIKGWIDNLTKMLTNVENAGAMLVTEIQQSLTRDKLENVDYVQIVPITDAMKDGKFLPDNQEAAANILYAFNIDPTILGFSGDKTSTSAGGSNKREAYLIALQMLAPFRQMLIEPLEFVAEYNGWKSHLPNLRFMFRDTLLTTLDTGAGTQDRLT